MIRLKIPVVMKRKIRMYENINGAPKNRPHKCHGWEVGWDLKLLGQLVTVTEVSSCFLSRGCYCHLFTPPMYLY